jgi:hypothetical protein
MMETEAQIKNEEEQQVTASLPQNLFTKERLDQFIQTLCQLTTATAGGPRDGRTLQQKVKFIHPIREHNNYTSSFIQYPRLPNGLEIGQQLFGKEPADQVVDLFIAVLKRLAELRANLHLQQAVARDDFQIEQTLVKVGCFPNNN